MSGLSRRLKQLDEELLALGEETMLLEELDGFIAGLLVCPDLIKPGEWLPIIWNRDSADQQPRPDRYSPLFSVDTRNGDILWELWIEGFETAVELRPEAWRKLLDADADTAAAISGMLMLAAIARGDQTAKDSDTVSATVPDKIANWVVTLNAWRLANYQPMQGLNPGASTTSTKKVGRNDPCPCGSGKKYKKCCGLN